MATSLLPADNQIPHLPTDGLQIIVRYVYESRESVRRFVLRAGLHQHFLLLVFSNNFTAS